MSFHKWRDATGKFKIWLIKFWNWIKGLLLFIPLCKVKIHLLIRTHEIMYYTLVTNLKLNFDSSDSKS